MIVVLLSCLAVLGAAQPAVPQPRVEKIYVERKRTSDLDSSASGYIYRNDGHGPGTYVTLGQEEAGAAYGQLVSGKGNALSRLELCLITC